jgi:hypothetical protein
MGGPNIVYKTHDQVSPTQCGHSYTISLASSQVGSVRTFYIVAAYADGTRLLRQNYDHQDPSCDGNRASLPSHSFVVSNRVLVTKQRG